MWAKVVAFAEDFFVFIGAWVFEARAPMKTKKSSANATTFAHMIPI